MLNGLTIGLLAAGASGMLPPRSVYSVQVINNCSVPINVTVVYGLPNLEFLVKESTIPTHENTTFEQELFNNGSWVATYEIVRVKAEPFGPSNSVALVKSPFNVSSPTQMIQMTVLENDGVLSFQF